MGLLDYFLSTQRPSASIAKERLQILVAHERAERNKPPYLADLQRELLEVIGKYVKVDREDITVTMDQDDKREILELNIVLPDDKTTRKRR